MNLPDAKSAFALAIPFLLLPSARLIFIRESCLLGREKGYLLGFLFYWLVWCLLVPFIHLGRNEFFTLFVDKTPLFFKVKWAGSHTFHFHQSCNPGNVWQGFH